MSSCRPARRPGPRSRSPSLSLLLEVLLLLEDELLLEELLLLEEEAEAPGSSVPAAAMSSAGKQGSAAVGRLRWAVRVPPRHPRPHVALGINPSATPLK